MYDSMNSRATTAMRRLSGFAQGPLLLQILKRATCTTKLARSTTLTPQAISLSLCVTLMWNLWRSFREILIPDYLAHRPRVNTESLILVTKCVSSVSAWRTLQNYATSARIKTRINRSVSSSPKKDKNGPANENAEQRAPQCLPSGNFPFRMVRSTRSD